jgi:hypothetical protein
MDACVSTIALRRPIPIALALPLAAIASPIPGIAVPRYGMVTVKIHLNSVVSTKGARYCPIDLKDFYLNTPMAHPEFMRMKLAELSKEFARIYKQHDLANTNKYISIKIQKGMYGLPQAGIPVQELLKKRLNKHGYCQSPITPGLWQHNFHLTSFTLCVDDFGIKYVGREHVKHLSGILKEHYKCSQDWSSARYLGMNIDWDYINKNVHVSMLNYVPEALIRLQHAPPTKPQHQPYPHAKPAYSATKQCVETIDMSPPLSKEDKKYVQEVVGTFSTMNDALTAQCLMLWDPLPPSRRIPPRTQ